MPNPVVPLDEQHPEDNGCSLRRWRGACITCDLEVCIEDARDELKLAKRKRNSQIRKAYKRGRTLSELVAMFGISYSSIRRIVHKADK